MSGSIDFDQEVVVKHLWYIVPVVELALAGLPTNPLGNTMNGMLSVWSLTMLSESR